MSGIHFNPLSPSSLYDELRAAQNHTEELAHCINEVMLALRQSKRDQTTNLRLPVALLGKIQSGKTRCMIGTMVKAFDEGIKIVLVLTKNSTLLGKQTTSRIASEITSLPSGRSIRVEYIRDINTSAKLAMAERHEKRVIVGIKHHTNVQRLYEFLVETNPELKDHEVLIIDDEADISSIGYRTVSENVINHETNELESQSRQDLLLVADKISQLREALQNHYYLQVTATPASIYLQPEDLEITEYNPDYSVNLLTRSPILSDKTVILPIHDKYVGGEFFFGESGDPDSLASFAHLAVDQAELDRLMKRDQRHINHIFRSQNFPNITHLVDNLLIAAACQVASLLKVNGYLGQIERFNREEWISILSNIKEKFDGLAAMIHVSTQIKLMSYHCELINSYVDACYGAVVHDYEGRRGPLKQRLKHFFEEFIIPPLTLFKNQTTASSHLIALETADFDSIFECYGKILELEHVKVSEINVSQPRSSYINPQTGELRRDVLANIFVGGQALDRGITIGRMVGFFYGRDPKVALLDTTLQHARIYGARTPEDLVFTRLYMPAEVRARLVEITEIDQVLRESIALHNGDNRFAAIELGKTGVRPTSPSRLMKSDCISLKSHKRLLPVGFVTRTGQACIKPVNAIDEIIRQQTVNIPEVSPTEEGYFVTWETFEDIFELFEASTLDRTRWSNEVRNDHWDLSRLRAYYQIIKKAYFDKDDRLMMIIKRGRTLTRLKSDGRTPLSSPDTSKTDLKQIKSLMRTHNVPTLMLFEQSGHEKYTSTGLNIGWSGERFFWPMLVLPELERTLMISLDSLRS